MHLSALDIEKRINVRQSIHCMQHLYLEDTGIRYATPLRSVYVLPAAQHQKKFLGLMPCYAYNEGNNDTRYVGTKCLAVFLGGNTHVKTHQGVYVLFDGEHGQLLCTMDAAAITALRTAASSAVAARAMLAHHSRGPLHVGIIGTGEQAFRHAAALIAVFQDTATPIGQLSILGRDAGRTQHCVDRCAKIKPSNVICKQAYCKEAMLSHIDILCTLTASPTPVVMRQNLQHRQSTHPLLILAVGACQAQHHELDPAIVAASRLPYVVDSLDGAQHEAGDLLAANVAPADMQSLNTAVQQGFVAIGNAASAISIYKSVGFGAQDLALAIDVFKTY